MRINQEYPNIGVQISQETEFDHREHTPVYTTTTDKNGNWKIEGVEPGTYNVVAEKEGWGWRYVLEYNATEKELLIKLYPEIIIENNVNNTIMMQEDQHLIIKRNIILEKNAKLVITNGAWIRLFPDVSVWNYGEMSIEQNNTKIIRIINEDLNNKWKSIYNLKGSKFFDKFCLIKNSKSGIRWENVKNIDIHYYYLNNNNIALQFSGCNNVNISSILLTKNYTGILFSNTDSIFINNTIMIKNSLSVKGSLGKLIMTDNYFYRNEGALDYGIGNFVAEHNNFELNETALNLIAKNKFSIKYNLFIFNTVDVASNYAYNNGAGKYIINFNNFINTKEYYFFQEQGSVLNTVDAKENWWDSDDVNEIQLKILDCNDNNELKCVDIFPIANNYISKAGLR